MGGRRVVLLWCLGVGVLGVWTVKVAAAKLSPPQVTVSRKTEVLKDGREICLWSISNKKMKLSLSSLGAAITSLRLSSKKGPSPSEDPQDDVVLSYPTQDQALASGAYIGVIVGRVANRIAGGKMAVDGKEVQVPCNDGGVNSLHGGDIGFSRCVWKSKVLDSGDGVQFSLLSPDGDQGYPNAVKAQATYRLKGNTLELEMTATSDGPTPVNLAQHSYFNLAGHTSGSVLGHKIRLNAEGYTPVDNLIPTGEVAKCSNSPFDFSRLAVIGQKIAELGVDRGLPLQYDVSNQILVDTITKEKLAPESRGGAKSGNPVGFDTNFVVNTKLGFWAKVMKVLKFWKKDSTFLVAQVCEESTGRTLTVRSTAPGVQFYTGNFLCDEEGKDSFNYQQYAGFCLETQHFPNSVNADPQVQPEFAAGKTPVISPTNPYYHKVTYTFGAK